MQIKIKRESSELLLQQYQSLWKHRQTQKDAMLTIAPIVFIISGSILVLLSFVNYKAGENFWNLETTGGMIFIACALNNYYRAFLVKRNFFKQVQSLIERHQKNKQGTEICISEDLISIKEAEVTTEAKWSYFGNITQNATDFFITVDKNYQHGLIISKKEMTEAEVVEFNNFIQTLY